jgi:hypothetical protein
MSLIPTLQKFLRSLGRRNVGAIQFQLINPTAGKLRGACLTIDRSDYHRNFSLVDSGHLSTYRHEHIYPVPSSSITITKPAEIDYF